LLTATDSWHKALEEGSDVCAVFLDLSKAFDKVPHRPLMDKLASLHVDPYVLRWLSDYLCQRSQCVAVNGEISTSSKVISGVPQGSVLGPLLFLIYINGISEVELHNGTIILYADDILLYRRIQSQADYLLFQKDIDLKLVKHSNTCWNGLKHWHDIKPLHRGLLQSCIIELQCLYVARKVETASWRMKRNLYNLLCMMIIFKVNYL